MVERELRIELSSIVVMDALAGNWFNDDGVKALVPALSEMKMLQSLNLDSK